MAKNEHPLVQAFLGIVVAACLTATSARADEEGYIDNWPGNLRLELASPDLPNVIPLPAERAGPALSERFRLMWADNQSRICGLIQAGFEASGSVREWRSCELAAAGELRGRAPSLDPNRLDLKYVVAGNQIRFVAPTPTVLGEWADPLVQADFQVVIRLTLVFATRLDLGQPPADGPISLLSGHIGFAGAKFRSSWDGIPVAGDQIAPRLRAGEADMNARVQSLMPDLLPLQEMNTELFSGAAELQAALESEDNRTPYFGLRTSLRQSDIVILFSRGSRPAVALSMCTCTSICEQRLHCTCGGAGVLQENERILLQRLMPGGAWTPSGASDPGTWSVDGDALGAADGENVTVRICSENQWGRNCGEPITFVHQDLGSCTPSHGPTPPPACPPGEMQCPLAGCRPIGQCPPQL